MSCQAKSPTPYGLLLCGLPTAQVHQYRCPNGHVGSGETCRDHEPKPGSVGCALCLEQGTDCEMTWSTL